LIIRSLRHAKRAELALKDVYNKKRLYSAIGFEKEKEREVLNTVS